MNDNKVMNMAADNIRILAASMVEKAKSGHPGGAMGGADFINTLYSEFLVYDPENPAWEGRDRFFLDPGHMSPMLYSALALQGWFTLDELKAMEPWKVEEAFYPPENRRDTSIPLPDFDAIHTQMISMGRKADLAYIWLDYKALHPDGYQQSQFYKLYRDYVQENFGTEEATMPVERIPGEKMYID